MTTRSQITASSARKGLVLVAALAPLLGACGQDTARSLGFTRDAPDEFQVVTRAPLSVPPSLSNLPIPRPGAPRPQDGAQQTTTLGQLAGFGSQGATQRSAAESALLAQAGPNVGGDIRRRVDEEALRMEQPDRSVVDRLMFWRDTPPPGIAVDPARESQRLRENAALGRPGVEGETPIIQRQRTGIFGGSGIF
ncbi:beta-barrel assembly complex subunit BamF [Humitalea rosea]|uniref:Beta-barrel assembly complex subunit BamF n=1 Tax=Humitalea rosea TaxID=990373 RepID=A0A2W7IIR0_9PROT|nr:DUF3035 domain-containing protein [Humitalea rosea]PZW37859.1 beta-barrel assembly complex subunit BamF [Humitalea rosea]